MDHFKYKNGELVAEDVSVSKMAATVGTPFYCYSTATIERHFRVFKNALAGLSATICYAVKANSNLAVIKILADMGAGADVVSSGELMRALRAGVPANKIVFSGVGKTKDELVHALKEDILQVNIESEPELHALNDVAGTLSKKARVAFRINPDINAHTHDKISTGRSEDKFGIEWARIHDVITRASKLPNIEIAGLAMHIGSQLTKLQPFRDAFNRLRDVVTTLRADGHSIPRLDLGGGLGIPYDKSQTPSPAEYGKVVKETLGDLGCNLLFEPGRLIVGNAGILVSQVVYVKEGATRDFLILDAAMNDLMRPSLYDAKHDIVSVIEPAIGVKLERVDVVGPVCETGDTFRTELDLPAAEAGDLLAIRSAGAYGAVMASTYNSRALVPEVMVKGSAYSIIRKRIQPETFINYESLPDWDS
jgi:diaminopimelate decarboxylase